MDHDVAGNMCAPSRVLCLQMFFCACEISGNIDDTPPGKMPRVGYLPRRCV